MIKKIRNFKFVIRLPALLRKALRAGNRQAGMTYVELIVVLSIFAVMTSVVLFNYGKFQEQVDIKVLANDIASKIVEAQKAAMSGEILVTPPSDDWKPSYGVYFDDSTHFVNFADTNSNKIFDGSICDTECLYSTLITKNDQISQIYSYSDSTPLSQITAPFSVTFTRPDTNATFTYKNNTSLGNFDHIQITISSISDSSIKSCINIYPSGRIQISECQTL